MYRTKELKIGTNIIYLRHLEERARAMSLEDLKAEIDDYEHQIENDDRSVVKRFCDSMLGVDAERNDRYQMNRLILEKRVSE